MTPSEILTREESANPVKAAFDDHIGKGFRDCIDALTDSFEAARAALSKSGIEK